MIESNFRKDLERKIDLYINGRLNQEEVDELWAELIQDEYYLDYTKSVANIKAVIEQKRSQEKVAPVFNLRQYVNYGVAAAVAIIIGVLGVLNYSSTTNALQLEPVTQFELGIVRGPGDAPAVTDNETIRKAIQLVSNGEVEEAISLLSTEIEKTTASQDLAELSLTLGSIQYNYGNYEASLKNFQVVVNQTEADVLILEKGYWYLGNTYFQLDQLSEAQDAFQKAYDLNGNYSRVAKSYLEALKSVR